MQEAIATDRHAQQQERFKRFLKVSTGLHIGLAAMMLFKYIVWPSTPEDFSATVQIDMVALPDVLKNANTPVLDKTLPVKDKEPPPPPPAPKEAAAPEKAKPEPLPKAEKDDAMALQKERAAESEAKKALDRLRKQVKKNQAQEEAREREELLDKKKEDLKRFEEAYRNAIKGNQTNEGTSTTGDLKATMNAYAGHVREVLRSHWALPTYLQDGGYKASVRIYLGAGGEVSRMQFTARSGNEMFDEAVSRTVQQSRFAPPPEEMSRGLRNSGMEVAFPL
jgi:TonB family protein